MIPTWAGNGVELYHAENLALLQSMTPDSVDHCLTDPPYGDFVHANARTEDPASGDGPREVIDFAPISIADLRNTLTLIARVTRRWVVFTCDRQYAALLERDPPDGLRFVQMGVFIRDNATPSFCGRKPGSGFELVVIMHREGVPMDWNGGGHCAVYQHMVPRGAKALGHHTQKPLGLGLEWVRQYTDPGETILDPWMGVGTFPEAAKRLGRKAIGCERDAKWFNVARERLSQGSLFGKETTE